MSLVLSNGFVIPANPPKAIYCTTAKIIVTQSVTAVWKHDCGGYGTLTKPYLIQRTVLACPQKNDRRFLITIRDQDGNLEDVSSVNEITFIIGKTVRTMPVITKTLTGGTITLTTNSQLQIDISDVESLSLGLGSNYFELNIENSSGDFYTALAGQFVVEDTRIGN